MMFNARADRESERQFISPPFANTNADNGLSSRKPIPPGLHFYSTNLLGFRFAPRIRDLANRRLYTAAKAKRYLAPQPFIGGAINLRQLLASGQRSYGLVAPSAWARWPHR